MRKSGGNPRATSFQNGNIYDQGYSHFSGYAVALPSAAVVDWIEAAVCAWRPQSPTWARPFSSSLYSRYETMLQEKKNRPRGVFCHCPPGPSTQVSLMSMIFRNTLVSLTLVTVLPRRAPPWPTSVAHFCLLGITSPYRAGQERRLCKK